MSDRAMDEKELKLWLAERRHSVCQFDATEWKTTEQAKVFHAVSTHNLRELFAGKKLVSADEPDYKGLKVLYDKLAEANRADLEIRAKLAGFKLVPAQPTNTFAHVDPPGQACDCDGRDYYAVSPSPACNHFKPTDKHADVCYCGHDKACHTPADHQEGENNDE